MIWIEYEMTIFYFYFFIFYEFMEGFECCYYVDLKWYLHLIISNQNNFFNIFKNEII